MIAGEVDAGLGRTAQGQRCQSGNEVHCADGRPLESYLGCPVTVGRPNAAHCYRAPVAQPGEKRIFSQATALRALNDNQLCWLAGLLA
jgi:hypothetical protein